MGFVQLIDNGLCPLLPRPAIAKQDPGQVAVGIGPEGVAQLLLRDAPAAEGDEGLEQLEGLLLHLARELDHVPVPLQFKLPEGVNPERPGPVVQMVHRDIRNKIAPADEALHIIRLDAGFEGLHAKPGHHRVHPEETVRIAVFSADGHGSPEELSPRSLIAAVKSDSGLYQIGHEFGLVKPVGTEDLPHFTEMGGRCVIVLQLMHDHGFDQMLIRRQHRRSHCRAELDGQVRVLGGTGEVMLKEVAPCHEVMVQSFTV